jgi:hypothetical protein
VRLEYLPIGIRFKSCNRVGILIDKTPSRALVEWESAPTSRSFTARNGEEITINSHGRQRTGCALDAAVVPAVVYGYPGRAYPRSKRLERVDRRVRRGSAARREEGKAQMRVNAIITTQQYRRLLKLSEQTGVKAVLAGTKRYCGIFGPARGA